MSQQQDQQAVPDVVQQENFQPNPEFLRALTDMGITSLIAEAALYYTQNNSAEMAAAWVFEHSDEDVQFPAALARSSQTEDTLRYEPLKMVFVVNAGLEMGVGKIAAQVAHAAIGIHRLLLQDEPKYGDMVLQWDELGETKIVLRGENTAHLVELEEKARARGLPSYLVQDAGKTQIPAGSTTVLALMGIVKVVDEVTGSLKLL